MDKYGNPLLSRAVVDSRGTKQSIAASSVTLLAGSNQPSTSEAPVGNPAGKKSIFGNAIMAAMKRKKEEEEEEVKKKREAEQLLFDRKFYPPKSLIDTGVVNS